MVWFDITLFLLALIGLVVLFVIKWREARGAMKLAPQTRSVLDQKAIHLKELMVAAEMDLTKVPGYAMYVLRALLHVAALRFAQLAHRASRGAHRLADLASHKHNFVRGETRSEFLKKMSERKINGQSTQDRVEF